MTKTLALAAAATLGFSAVASASFIQVPLWCTDLNLAGGEMVSFDIDMGPGVGPVVGLSFSGFFEGPSAFGGDLKMELFGPSGSYYGVGGYDNPAPYDWDFGSYTDINVFLQHDDYYVFTSGGDGTTTLEGTWTLNFTLDWAASSGHNWTNATVCLYLIPAPGSLALLGLGALVVRRRR